MRTVWKSLFLLPLLCAFAQNAHCDTLQPAENETQLTSWEVSQEHLHMTDNKILVTQGEKLFQVESLCFSPAGHLTTNGLLIKTPSELAEELCDVDGLLVDSIVFDSDELTLLADLSHLFPEKFEQAVDQEAILSRHDFWPWQQLLISPCYYSIDQEAILSRHDFWPWQQLLISPCYYSIDQEAILSRHDFWPWQQLLISPCYYSIEEQVNHMWLPGKLMGSGENGFPLIFFEAGCNCGCKGKGNCKGKNLSYDEDMPYLDIEAHVEKGHWFTPILQQRASSPPRGNWYTPLHLASSCHEATEKAPCEEPLCYKGYFSLGELVIGDYEFITPYGPTCYIGCDATGYYGYFPEHQLEREPS